MICLDYGQPDGITVDGVTVFKCHAPIQGLPVIRFVHPRLTGMWSALRRVDADIYYQRSAAAQTGVIGLFARRYGRRFVYAAACDLDLARDRTWKLFQRRAGWRDMQLFQLGLKLADHVVAQHAGQMQDCKRWYGRVPAIIPSCYVATARQYGGCEWRCPLGFRAANGQATGAFPGNGATPAASAFSNGRRPIRRSWRRDFLRANQRGGGNDSEPRIRRVRALCRDRRALRRRPRLRQHVRLRRVPEHLSSVLVALDPHGQLLRHGIDAQRQAGRQRRRRIWTRWRARSAG